MNTPAPAAVPLPHSVLLPQLVPIGVLGKDAQPFLQNQLTCDVRLVVPGRAEPGALCTHKGRVVAVFDLLPWPEGYLLVVDRSAAPALLEHLKKMIFRSKVTVEPPPLEVSGWFAEPPAGVTAFPRRAHRWLSITPAAGAGLVGAGLVGAGLAAGDGPPKLTTADALLRWELAEIEAAIPLVTPATAELFLPQFLNLDLAGGLSFSKGCYPGQEVVTRTQHLGEVKRRMFHARLSAAEAPAPGTPLRAIHADGERDGGTVVRAALAAPGDVRLLAVVPTVEHASQRPIHLAAATGPRLHFA